MKKKQASTFLIGFIAFLALCTYLSATFSSMLAARVTLCIPTSRVLEDYTFVSSIVPESALVLENEVFIAVPREDIWGTVLVARPVTVAIKDLGDGEVAIIEGLVGNESVIISWDRPLDFDMQVIEE